MTTRATRIIIGGILLVAIALLPAVSSAKGPVINRFSWENSPEFFADCAAAGYGDYMIVGESDGFGSEKLWFDANGQLVRAQVYLHIDNTIINTGTGQTWRDIGRHTAFFWEFTELGPNLQKRAGVSFIIHDPDGGIILHDTGTITFNFETGEIEHVGGPHDVGEIGTPEEFNEVFCTTFA